VALGARHVAGAILIIAVVTAGYLWLQRPSRAHPARATDAIREVRGAGAQDAAPPLFKWQDAAGTWHYTDQAPTDRPYQVIVGTANVSSVPSVVPDSGIVAPAGAPPAQ